MATIIRVKRKRAAKPAEALLLGSKKMKLDEHFCGNSGMADIIQIEENVFRFATTVRLSAKMDEDVKKKVKDAIVLHSKINCIYKTKPVFNHTRSIVGVPMLKATESGNTCYKPLQTYSHDPGLHKANVGAQEQSYSVSSDLNNHQDTTMHSYPEETQSSMFPVLDVEEQESREFKSFVNHEDVLCNSVKMLREKLCFSDPETEDSEYVYDLYYCQKTQAKWNVKDIIYVQPCRDLNLCYKTEKRLTNYHEDEDSNDEDHWKNDYPDEDSIDDEEKRFFLDEEEDRYESDDCENIGHNDEDLDDNLTSYFTSHVNDAINNDDVSDLDYGDDLNYDMVGDINDCQQDNCCVDNVVGEEL